MVRTEVEHEDVFYDESLNLFGCARCGQVRFQSAMAVVGHQRSCKRDAPQTQRPQDWDTTLPRDGGARADAGGSHRNGNGQPQGARPQGQQRRGGRRRPKGNGRLERRMDRLERKLDHIASHVNDAPHRQQVQGIQNSVPPWAAILLGATGGGIFGLMLADGDASQEDRLLTGVKWAVVGGAGGFLFSPGGPDAKRQQAAKEILSKSIGSLWA